ncbi:PTS sugar transporter subunit IIA [Enterococcus sp. AZ072]|uniref:PTS sugar transporter subunit IIA n=1 Tax=unclassified Enterococcus TaxID=2608891 RepID=UPI003D275385
MFKIIIVTHGSLASGFADTLEYFLPEERAVTAIDLGGKSLTAFEAEITEAINGTELPILALVDLFQGTPFKTVYGQLVHRPGSQVVSNANFGSVLTAAMNRNNPLSEVMEEILAAGQQNMYDPQQLLMIVNEGDE